MLLMRGAFASILVSFSSTNEVWLPGSSAHSGMLTALEVHHHQFPVLQLHNNEAQFAGFGFQGPIYHEAQRILQAILELCADQVGGIRDLVDGYFFAAAGAWLGDHAFGLQVAQPEILRPVVAHSLLPTGRHQVRGFRDRWRMDDLIRRHMKLDGLCIGSDHAAVDCDGLERDYG